MSDLSQNFELFNLYSNKNISIVVKIDGYDELLGNRAFYSAVRYGDPGVDYGDPGLVYGALRLRASHDILSLDASSLTISQRLEPEQGRGSVSTLTLAFIDKDKFMTRLTSPGIILPEIMGRGVTVYVGYEQISFPQDYLVMFRGIINSVKNQSGLVYLQLSDPNIKRRQDLFYSAQTNLSAAINGSPLTTTIPVVSAGDFTQQILGPDGTYDSAIKTYIQIDEEFIEYPPTGISGNSFVGCTRGSRGTAAAPHLINAPVTAYVQIQDHAIDMALKLMLSGWGGNWKTGEVISGIVNTGTGLGNVANSITFPVGVDVVKDFGLSDGDQITISGATNGANNVTRNIVDILDADGDPNRVITVDGAALVVENPTTGVIAFRSQYDTYPDTCGLKLTPNDVDVEQHEYIKNTFLGDNENTYRFFITGSEAGKDFIESEVYLPVACYSLTRRGRLSVQITKAPLASADLVILTQYNVLNPEAISVDRTLTNRKFFNEINIQYDYSDAGVYESQQTFLDSDSLNEIGILSVLPITSRGSRSDLAIDITSLLTRRANYFLSRYKRAANTIPMKVNWGIGVQIEAGDVVAVNGENLQIANNVDGTRDFGVQLLEVVNRTADLKNGIVDLLLISGVGASATDRFGVISPSSVLGAGSTTTQIVIVDSFSAANPRFPLNEPKKWKNYVGQPIRVHSEDYSFDEEVTFVSFDSGDHYKLNVTPLSAPPPAGYVIDIPPYPTSTDTNENALYKAVHAFLSPQVLVATGISSTQFTVAPGDAAKFFVGAMVRVHNYSYSIDSDDVTVSDVTGVTVTVSDMGFTPATGQYIDLIGFADEGGAYRWI